MTNPFEEWLSEQPNMWDGAPPPPLSAIAPKQDEQSDMTGRSFPKFRIFREERPIRDLLGIEQKYFDWKVEYINNEFMEVPDHGIMTSGADESGHYVGVLINFVSNPDYHHSEIRFYGYGKPLRIVPYNKRKPNQEDSNDE